MNKANILLVLCALLSVAVAEAPLASGFYPAPAPVYGPPRIELPPRPVPVLPAPAPYAPAIPVPVYGVPKVELPPPQIVTNYDYNVYTPKRIQVVAPYAAPLPIVRSAPYQAPVPVEIVKPIVPVTSAYHYDLPRIIPKIEQPVIPVPVYGVPKIEVPLARAPIQIPIVPVPTYGVPKVGIPAAPVLTTYNYALPPPTVRTLAPYPAPVARIPEVPVAPHSVYGAPLF